MSDYIEGMGPDDRLQRYFDPKILKRGKKKPSASNALTSAVIQYIKAVGGVARRVNSQGQWDPVREMWRLSGMKRGFEDVDGVVPVTVGGVRVGLKVAVEVKGGKDRQSEYQVLRMDEVRRCGGVYIVAKNIDQFMADLNKALLEY